MMGVIGFLGYLALIFIGLKLAQVGVVASWSWVWVLAPLWAFPAALVVYVACLFLFFWIKSLMK